MIGQIACFGDCLLATTLARQIKQDEPESHITWAVAAKYRSVLEHNPYIDEIWELPIYTRNIGIAEWYDFEEKAELKKQTGVFDELLNMQIFNTHILSFFTTLRHTVFKIFNRPITVDIAPVIELTPQEVDNVARFARQNRLDSYKNVVLFECAPTSDQSQLNVPFAKEIALTLANENKDTCFILTTSDKLDIDSNQIIDASVLSFRENAELTKYCTLLIGCSSGITWLSTSAYCKRLPMIQLLNERSMIFAGVNFDFEINGLDNGHIIEMTDYDRESVLRCIRSVFQQGVPASRREFNQAYKPNKYSLQALAKMLVELGVPGKAIWRFMKGYIRENREFHNVIRLNRLYFLFRLSYWKVYHSRNKYVMKMRRTIKPLVITYKHVKPD